MRRPVFKIQDMRKYFKFKYLLFFCIFMILFLPRGVGIYFGSFLPILDLPRIFIGGLILSWLIKKFVKREPFSFGRSNSNFFLLFLIFFQFISIFVSQAKVVSFTQWAGFVVCYYMIYFIVLDETKSLDDCKRIVNVLIFVTICLAILSIYESSTRHKIYEEIRTAWNANPLTQFKKDINRGGARCSYGPYGSPHDFGLFFASTFFLLINSFVRRKEVWRKIINALLICIVIIAIICTHTRGALLAIFITSLFSVIVIKREYRFRLFLGAVIFLLIGILLFSFFIFPEQGVGYFSQWYFKSLWGHSGEVTSGLGGRIYAIKCALPLMKDMPFFGFGMGSFSKYQWVPSPIDVGPDLNIYCGIMLESGIFAAVMFILLIMSSFFKLLAAYRRQQNGREAWLIFSLFLSICSYSIAHSTGAPLDSSFAFFILLAIAQRVTMAKAILSKPAEVVREYKV